MFETKRRRGLLLVVLFVSVLVIFLALNSWASRQAYQRAETTTVAMRSELKRVGLTKLLLPIDNQLDIPNLRSILPAENGATAASEVLVLWQYRCVVGHIDAAGDVSVEVSAQPCG